jgi:hypothetical protein
MPETESPNIVELKPTATTGKAPRTKPSKTAQRMRRYRRRKRNAERAEPVTQPVTQGVARKEDRTVTPHPTATVTIAAPDERNGMRLITLTASLACATVSGGFSIVGLTAIFAGAFWPVVAMGVALETGKLSAVAWLGNNRNGSVTLKIALVIVVAALMALNSIGVYGYLSRAHIAHALAGDLAVAGRAADVEARLSVQSGVVTDLDRRIAQIDTAVEESSRRGRTVGAMGLADQQRRNRAELVAARIKEAKALAALRVERPL